ncbi:hypothetical protein [Treponema sp.]|uniref:hypothetical protein n=1 Tax=Treponema sp. TaxID=166 RepID=UPI003FA1DBD6
MNNDVSKGLVISVAPAVSEQGTGEHSDTDMLDMQSMFNQLLQQANHAAHEAEAHLQVEEKSNSVAELQGFCAGIRNFKSTANKAGFVVPPALFDTANRMEPWIRRLDSEEDDGDMECTLELDVLIEFSRTLDLLTTSDSYTELEEIIKSSIRAKKDFLYSEAKSARDLFWIRGWHRGFTWIKTEIKELYYWKNVKEQQAAKRAKEKASELPFGDDVA